MSVPELELADWRRQMQALYTAVRAEEDPVDGHTLWRTGRDELFRRHPQSPLPVDDPLRETGLAYEPYDPGLRFELALQPTLDPGRVLELPSGETGSTMLRTIGRVVLPAPVGASLEVWWLDQYAGGLFLPLRDGSAGHTSYGGGRYLLDTAKGADLGATAAGLIVDLNFLYHPSCRYDSSWLCPLAPSDNTTSVVVTAGERMAADVSPARPDR